MVIAPNPLSARNKTLVVIPVRHDSGRLPGKALESIGGEPMVWRVVERAVQAGVGAVVVATDDERIARAVTSRGGDAVMTSPTARNGTERVAEVVRGRSSVEIAINLQGDEPLFDPAAIVALHQCMVAEPDVAMATVALPLVEADLGEPSVVKVEVSPDGYAAAFWRAPPATITGDVFHHAGIYAFRRSALMRYAGWPPTAAERNVSLEQLRAMDHGLPIRVVCASGIWPSVNTRHDLERVRRGWDGGEPPP
jgi:3-deoxy-manno-octulosonate cytidylyltransferase (CMP-KDO synthetase)